MQKLDIISERVCLFLMKVVENRSRIKKNYTSYIMIVNNFPKQKLENRRHKDLKAANPKDIGR